MTFKKIHVVVMDSVGIGEAPYAEKFGDIGSDTLGHIAAEMNGLTMPNMAALGLSNIREIQGIEKATAPQAYFTKMQEASPEKVTSCAAAVTPWWWAASTWTSAGVPSLRWWRRIPIPVRSASVWAAWAGTLRTT